MRGLRLQPFRETLIDFVVEVLLLRLFLLLLEALAVPLHVSVLEREDATWLPEHRFAELRVVDEFERVERLAEQVLMLRTLRGDERGDRDVVAAGGVDRIVGQASHVVGGESPAGWGLDRRRGLP